MFFNMLRMALVLTLPVQQLIAQIEVKTVVADLKASGGVTAGPEGMLIVSDFGDALNAQGQLTKVYEYEPATGQDVERRRHLGRHQRIPVGKYYDTRAYYNPRGPGCNGG